jgi:hypothetical protein
LELPAEEVPHFGAMSLEEWWPATQDWLNARGLFLLEWDYDPEGFALPGYTLLSGKSPRGDYDHTVVGWGLEPVHDPHPSRSGLVGAPKRWAVFVALDPSAAIPKESLVGDRGPG